MTVDLTCRNAIRKLHAQPIPFGMTFWKAVSKLIAQKLERLFCHVSVKRDVRALSFARAFENVTPNGITCTIFYTVHVVILLVLL